jgi:hypothetical protein
MKIIAEGLIFLWFVKKSMLTIPGWLPLRTGANELSRMLDKLRE